MNASNPNNEKTDEATPIEKSDKQSQCIFSPEEIRTTVKNFALGWLNGVIKVDFKEATEIMSDAKLKGEEKGWNRAMEEEKAAKKQFIDVVSICSGNMEATAEQQKKAISDLFYRILIFRAGNRLTGSFISSANIEEKIRQIEDELKETRELIFELSLAVRQWKPKE